MAYYLVSKNFPDYNQQCMYASFIEKTDLNDIRSEIRDKTVKVVGGSKTDRSYLAERLSYFADIQSIEENAIIMLWKDDEVLHAQVVDYMRKFGK